ncbi:MAG TPA: hypothetical protein VEU55_06230 [Gemmatimonadales bacterium]|nr:hypothetical protein [Gemmatimonadales bacterium]
MRMRLAAFSGLAVVCMLGAVPPTAAQQVVKLGEGETLTISGFINGSLFNSRGLFGGLGVGQGQQAEFPAAPGSETKGIFDGDVRNTRINFTFASGPVLGKWSPRATIEADFFGAFNGAPPFGDEQPQFRVRHAYIDFTNGRTTLRIGQYWAPFFNTDIPVSLVHIAFPVGLGSGGVVGWRFPGVFLYHDLTPASDLKLQLVLAALKGSGAAVGASDVANGIGSGEASGAPQVEARLNAARKFDNVNWNGYVVYHTDWKRVGGTTVPGTITDWGVETGQYVAIGNLTLHGNFNYGKGLGQQFANITQFQPQIRGWGAWAQAGYDFTSHWSVWGDYGTDQPDYARFFTETGGTLVRQLSHVGSALLRFRAGRYAAGLEYFRAVTRYSTGTTAADQYALSALYSF